MWIPRRHVARVAQAAQEEVSTRGLGNQHTFIHTLYGTRRSIDWPPPEGAPSGWPAPVYATDSDSRDVGFMFPSYVSDVDCRSSRGIGLICNQLKAYRPIRG